MLQPDFSLQATLTFFLLKIIFFSFYKCMYTNVISLFLENSGGLFFFTYLYEPLSIVLCSFHGFQMWHLENPMKTLIMDG